jgi:hypothetical protein
MRRAEALAREDRERGYAELETELHRVWRKQPVDNGGNEASPGVVESEADTSQPELTTDK